MKWANSTRLLMVTADVLLCATQQSPETWWRTVVVVVVVRFGGGLATFAAAWELPGRVSR